MSPDAPPADAPVSAADVRAALEALVRSGPLARSPQLQRLLTFLVEETLAGRGDRLKEYVIGLEVFARPASYDPRVDSLVRVEARRLRAALAACYAADGTQIPVVIGLAKGSYVPTFRVAAGARVAQRASRRRLRLATVLLVLAGALALAVGVARFLGTKPVQALTDRDLVLLAGFANDTGDPVFDETLRQGLATELEQSPFLNIVSERRVGQILKLMGATASDPLEPALARDVCVRAGGKVAIHGSIHRLGAQYVVALTATDCGTGDDVLHVQEQAARKEAVLRALSTAAKALRSRLGESLASIQRFGLPVEEATTSSLEALQAYSLGRATAREKGSPADIPFYQRALELDPQFAAAHAALGVSYVNQGQRSAGADHLAQAHRLRERVSEREGFRISAYYLQAVTGELEKASEVYELWRRSYPREFAPHVNLGLARLWLGDYEQAVEDTEEAARLEPGNVLPYTNLAALFIKLGRSGEAAAVLQQAADRQLGSAFLRMNLCYLAFLAGDDTVIERHLAEVRGSPGDEAFLLSLKSDTEAWRGRLRQARELSRQAADASLRAGGREAAANWLLNSALREAEFGNRAAARVGAREALELAGGRDVTTLAALAYARAGETRAAAEFLERLRAEHRTNTVLAAYWGPAIEAALVLAEGDGQRALEVLGPAARYELASPPPIGLATLYPVYLRGEACLRLGDGTGAEREFQKVLDHPGLVLNFPLHALAHLGVGRARRLSGDSEGARPAYDRFLGLWKDADVDLPVLRAARSERRALR